jgi:hypothetical protein
MWGEAYFLPLPFRCEDNDERFQGVRPKMTGAIILILLLVVIYFLWSVRRALIHICVQLSLLCKFTEEIKCHVTGTEPNPDDDLNKILGLKSD